MEVTAASRDGVDPPPSLLSAVEARDLKALVQQTREDPAALLQLVKDAGIAGAVSYTAVELTFFAIALPVGYLSWHASTGEWLQPLLLLQADSVEGKARLLGLLLSYVVLLKTLFPLRLGSTLLLTPYTKRLLDSLPSLDIAKLGWARGADATRTALKTELLALTRQSRGGIDGFDEDGQRRFDEVVGALIECNPTQQPARSLLLSGEWECEWTSEKEVLRQLLSSQGPAVATPPLPHAPPRNTIGWIPGRQVLFAAERGLFGLPWERTYQRIDMNVGSLENVIQFRGGELLVGSSITPEGGAGGSADGGDLDGRRFRFAFKQCSVQWGSIRLPLPPVGQGWGDLVYLDEEMRIQRDIRGDLLVTTRVLP